MKLLLLTEGGVAVIGTWADGAGFVAWSYLPKRAVRRGEPQLSTECTTCGAIVLGVADKYDAQPSADLEHLRALLADCVQYVTDDGLRAAIHEAMGDGEC